jgi:hypothetical protein
MILAHYNLTRLSHTSHTSPVVSGCIGRNDLTPLAGLGRASRCRECRGHQGIALLGSGACKGEELPGRGLVERSKAAVATQPGRTDGGLFRARDRWTRKQILARLSSLLSASKLSRT